MAPTKSLAQQDRSQKMSGSSESSWQTYPFPTEDTYFEQLHDKEFSPEGGISGQRFQGSDPAFMCSAEKPLQEVVP